MAMPKLVVPFEATVDEKSASSTLEIFNISSPDADDFIDVEVIHVAAHEAEHMMKKEHAHQL